MDADCTISSLQTVDRMSCSPQNVAQCGAVGILRLDIGHLVGQK